MWSLLVLAATLIVWNLTPYSIIVWLDGKEQCIVESHQACKVTGVSSGSHTLDTGATHSYVAGAGEVKPSGQTAHPIYITWQNGWYKLCRFSGHLIPDDCDKWIKDSLNEDPPGVHPHEVTYR